MKNKEVLQHRLTKHVSSKYVDAANAMRSKRDQQKQRVVAYVESYDDIAFWRYILEQVNHDQLIFEVKLPGNGNLNKGKKQVLMQTIDHESLGKNMIACVDSDFDFLLGDATRTSSILNQNPFVFQTYAYAIENFQCFADSLHEVVVKSTLVDRRNFDFNSFLEEWSKVVFPLFLWTVYYYKNYDTHSYPMYAFNKATMLHYVNHRNPKKMIDAVKKSVTKELNILLHRDRAAQKQVDLLIPEMKQKGFVPETSYLYVQGHHLMEGVVLKLLQPICAELRKEQELEIKRLAMHKVQEQNELASYQHSQIDAELMLRKNNDYKNLYLYQWVIRDLEDFLQQRK